MNRDYKLGALAGFLTGICLIPTAWNIGYHHTGILVALPFVCAVGIMFGIWLGRMLAAFMPVMYQIAKFAAVGFLNTAINFGILNLASLATGVTAGLLVGGYNVPGTIVAATNSYFWNKFWVFQGTNKTGSFADIPKFIIVTIIGLLVNSFIIVAFTSYLEPSFGFNSAAWLNIGKVLATIVGVVVDFLGYKFLVFRSKSQS
jgi:putative flippase GtrA